MVSTMHNSKDTALNPSRCKKQIRYQSLQQYCYYDPLHGVKTLDLTGYQDRGRVFKSDCTLLKESNFQKSTNKNVDEKVLTKLR